MSAVLKKPWPPTDGHMQGPWRAFQSPRKTSNFDGTYRQVVLGPSIDGHTDPVAYALGFTREECAGNAQLIATAPELKAQLRTVGQALRKYGQHERDCARFEITWSNCTCGLDALLTTLEPPA